MIRVDYAMLLLQGVLALLAVYHLAIGALSALVPRTAARVAGALYGLAVVESPQLRYALRMLGLYALALGALLAVAAWRPAEHRATIGVALGLQLARALSRVLLRRELAAAFAVSAARNAIATAILVAEATLLGVGLLLTAP